MQANANPIEQSKFNQTLLVDPFGQSYFFLPAQANTHDVPAEQVQNSIEKYNIDALLQNHSVSWGQQFDIDRLYQQVSNDYLAHHKSRQDKLSWLSRSIMSGEVSVFKGENFAPLPPTDAEGGIPVAASTAVGNSQRPAERPSKALGLGGYSNEFLEGSSANQAQPNFDINNEAIPIDKQASIDTMTKLAKSEGDSMQHIKARETVARDYLENNGFTKDQIHDALGSPDGTKDGGVDLTQPLEVISFPPPESMSQHVKSHGYPGNWFDPKSNQSPDSLGISGEGRTSKPFTVVKGTGLKSSAKPVKDNWTTPGVDVHCSGGGTQLLVNDEIKNKIIEINPKGI
ncbi:hypothetical protein [Agarivorans albus]|uniref:Bacterial toxin 46 domain-containing protein n=1 Tax=Agarivorans albus MKT 106 TaxID=1331007 RepID=R9PRW5_AGAAL|nr:hypothetical protein [Agarivorans albus]GAD00826.1 hypothetical protein AALB_0906 [Agarivorans albus MKT 106]